MSAAPCILDELDTDPPVSLKVAAAQFGVSVRTIQLDIAKGAPVFRPGRRGGEGALIRVGELRDWRRGLIPANRIMDAIGEGLKDTLHRDAGTGFPAHVGFRIPAHEAAALYLHAYRRLCHRLLGEIPDDFPEAVAALMAVAEKRS